MCVQPCKRAYAALSFNSFTDTSKHYTGRTHLFFSVSDEGKEMPFQPNNFIPYVTLIKNTAVHKGYFYNI